MMSHEYPDIQALDAAFDAIDGDARSVVTGLTEEQGVWRPAPQSWSVAHCLDHLATANRVYLQAMAPAADQALQRKLGRRGPALPGLIGRWFVRTLEPPVKPRFKMKAPRKIVPRESPPLQDAAAQFLSSHEHVRSFLHRYADIDLAGVHFPNPFIRGVRFSLATGLHVLAAHDRRHLWQAWNVRRALEERAVGRGTRA